MSSQREFERKMEEHIEEMRVTQTIAYFSRTVELCFNECVHSFRSKKMDDKELSCVNSCAEKFLRHTMRSSVRLQESYAEIMQQQEQQQQQQYQRLRSRSASNPFGRQCESFIIGDLGYLLATFAPPRVRAFRGSRQLSVEPNGKSAAMRGAMYLFPLYANASDGEAGDGREQVHPLPAPPWATEDTTTSESFDVTQLAAMLANVQSDLVDSNSSATMDPIKTGGIPQWMQNVLTTGCLGETTRTLGLKRKTSTDTGGLKSSKRARASLEHDQEVNLSSTGEEGMLSSSYESDDEESAPRILITKEAQVSGTVESYSVTFAQILDKLNQRQQTDAYQSCKIDLFDKDEVKTLLQSLKAAEKMNLIGKMDADLLLILMGEMDKQVKISRSLDLNVFDDADGLCKMSDRVRLGLDICICMLVVISTPDIDRRFLSDEWIENCIQLLSYVTRYLVMPVVDPHHIVSGAPSLATDQSKHEGDAIVSTARRSTKKSKRMIRAISRLIPVVCELMNQLSKLVITVKLPDRWIMHLTSSMVLFFAVDHSTNSRALQRSSMSIMRAIIMEYKEHRSILLDEVLAVMLKLPTTKKNLRAAKLSNSSQYVQMISTLICSLIQACASTSAYINDEDKSMSDAKETMSATILLDNAVAEGNSRVRVVNSAFTSIIAEVREIARHFVSCLVRECVKKNDDRDNRVVLENFIDDLLLMFVRPEWSGAEILLEVVSASLASILSATNSKDSKKVEAQYSLTALNLIGKICASIKMNRNMVARDIIDEDNGARVVVEEHERFLELTHNFDSQAMCRTTALKHIIMVFMRRDDHLNLSRTDSKRLLLARFIAEEVQDDNGTDDKVSLWESFWNKGSIDPASKIASPSQEFALRCALHVAATRDFCCLFEKLVAHIMSLLSNGVSKFRSGVLKAISGIVDVDPTLMADGAVQMTVRQCFLDEGISVRQSAVDLVGRHIQTQPVLFDRYCDILAERLRDKGISVRKSVCKIFRHFLTVQSGQQLSTRDACSISELHHKSTCIRSMVERIGDQFEDESIKNYIIDTFQEIWFGADLIHRPLTGFGDEELTSDLPPGWMVMQHNSKNENVDTTSQTIQNADHEKQYVSPDGRIVSSFEEAWSAYRNPLVTPSSIVKFKRSKYDDSQEVINSIVEAIHDLPSLDWIISLLKRLLTDNWGDDVVSRNGKTVKDRSEQVEVARARSEKLVDSLFEALIRLEEGVSLTGVTISDSQLQFVTCIKALSAFCEAMPSLLLKHLDLLMVYSSGDEKLSQTNALVVQRLVILMLNNVFSRMNRVVPRIIDRMENELKNLVFRAPPSIVEPSIKCLSTLATKTKKPPAMLYGMLETFYSFLMEFKDSKPAGPMPVDISSKLQRALFACGKIVSDTDMDRWEFPDQARTLKKGCVTQSLYETYVWYLKVSGSTLCASKAVQGFGFLFTTTPRLLLQAHQDDHLTYLLTQAPNEMKWQCLASLKALLVFEERRLQSGNAATKMDRSKSKKDQVHGDQEADASLIGSVMQAQLGNILSLSHDKSIQIRGEAVACVCNLLIQGLVSPIHCIPYLVALETDQIPRIRDLAHNQLIALHEKFPTILNNPSIQGIVFSHEFQMNAFGKWSVLALDNDKKSHSLLGRLYLDCVGATRAHRNMFLKALINQFADNGAVVLRATAREKPIVKTLDYFSYLAQLLGVLPYNVEDEPLYLIYLINRHVSLKLGSTMDELKKMFLNLGIAPELLCESDPDLSEIDSEEIAPTRKRKISEKDMKTLEASSSAAFAMYLLIQLKFSLKDKYRLSNEKCQTYRPENSAKATDYAVVASERKSRFKVVDVMEVKDIDAVERSWKLYYWTWSAQREDHHQMDFADQDISAQPRERRRKSVAKQQVSKNGEDVNNVGRNKSGRLRKSIASEDGEDALAKRRSERIRKSVAKQQISDEDEGMAEEFE